MKIANYNINNKLILAPMAGVSDYPFRTICRDYGCELAFSEMISSEGLVRKSEKTFNYLYKADEGGNGKLIAFQIFGSKPDVMAAAAEIVVEKGADIVDINMGCPVKKVIKANAGSALLSNIPLLKNIVTAVRKRISKALTVKIRSGWQNEINVLEVSRVLEDCGVDAIILHPRTQKQGFSGYANWELIKKVKEIVKIPVIGNGDVLTYSDYKKMLNETSCDGVMIARGAMGNPWIFKSIMNEYYKPTAEEMKLTIIKHYNLSINLYGEEKAVKLMRKHISWYSKGFQNGAWFRSKNNSIYSSIKAIQEINNFFSVQDEKLLCSLT